MGHEPEYGENHEARKQAGDWVGESNKDSIFVAISIKPRYDMVNIEDKKNQNITNTCYRRTML